MKWPPHQPSPCMGSGGGICFMFLSCVKDDAKALLFLFVWIPYTLPGGHTHGLAVQLHLFVLLTDKLRSEGVPESFQVRVGHFVFSLSDVVRIHQRQSVVKFQRLAVDGGGGILLSSVVDFSFLLIFELFFF